LTLHRVLVFANSAIASSLILMHTYLLRNPTPLMTASIKGCNLTISDLLSVGIIANYAAVAADTFSSELGILSKSQPRLITSPTFRKVPPGTNGGVTAYGLLAGVLGSMVVVTAGIFFLPVCGQGANGSQSAWTKTQVATLMLGLTAWGALGSIVDSFLGGWLQQSVRDVRTNKIVEGEGGIRVLVAPETGAGLLKKEDDKSPLIHGKASATAEDATAGIVSKTSRRASIKAAVLSGEGEDAIAKLDSTLSGSGDTASSSAVADEGENEKEEVVARNRYDAKDKGRTASFGNSQPTRVVESGWDLLDNNDVNLLMAGIMSIGAMAVTKWYFDVPVSLQWPPA
jgi:uncharacterized membrane protein